MRTVRVNGSFNVRFNVCEKLPSDEPPIEEIITQVNENFVKEIKEFLIGEGGFNTCEGNDVELEIYEEF